MNPEQHDDPAIEYEVTNIEAGVASFASEVLLANQMVVVLFWAPWSSPCQIMGAVLSQVAAACGWRTKIIRVNADDNPEISLLYEVEKIPTLLFFADGVLRARIVGTASKEAILAKLGTLASMDQRD